MTEETRSTMALEAEVERLNAEVARLTQDKEDLEVLLDTTTRHADFVEAELAQTVQALQEEQRKLSEERSLTNRLRSALADMNASETRPGN